MASNSFFEYTIPVGFEGELRINSFVLLVALSKSWRAVILKFVFAFVGRNLDSAPQIRTISG